jgi:hypothetical protein
MKNTNKQKGFSIYLVMIVLSMILSVSLNVAAIIVNSAKMSTSLGDGVRAYHIADSGIEHALYNVTRSTWSCDDIDDISDPFPERYVPISGETSTTCKYAYTVVITDGSGGLCPASANIVSTGLYNNTTKRIVEVNY